MEFHTQIDGIPCICKVTGKDEFDFEILDRKGYRALWLERKVDEHIEFRLQHEYLKIVKEFNASMAMQD